jgi:hypothetical protein
MSVIVGAAVTGQRGDLFHSLQDFNDPQSLSRKAEQCRNDFEVVGRCSLPERYLKPDLSVILELASKPNSRSINIGSGDNYREVVNRPIFVLQFHAVNANDGKYRNQEMMFVVNVEVVDGTNVSIPTLSLVRFHALYQEIEHGRIGRYFSCLRERRFKMLPIVADDEFSALGVEPIRTEDSDSFSVSNVESAVEIVNCIANHQGNVRAQLSISKAVVNELLPRLTVEVHTGSVCVRRGEESLVDISDVLVGPFDL